MTVLEGVVMYLTAPALDATFACVASYSALDRPSRSRTWRARSPGSESARFAGRLAAVRLVGEPFRSTFFEAKLSARVARTAGFRLERDESTAQAGARLLQVDIARTKRL